LDCEAEGEAATVRAVYMISVVSGQGTQDITARLEAPDASSFSMGKVATHDSQPNSCEQNCGPVAGPPTKVDVSHEGEVSRFAVVLALPMGFWGGVKDLASIKVEFNLRGAPIPDGGC
jgi:hypothetical protein